MADLPPPSGQAEGGNAEFSIRSYVLRQGRITKAQQRAWRDHADTYLISAERAPPGGWVQVFGRAAPLVVEIGCGYGEATAALAAAQPQVNYLALEVHTPGIGALMKQLARAQLGNVRIARADALRVLPHLLATGSVAGFNVFFPDPWHKKKHHKRRLMRAAVVEMLARRLAPGGGIHMVTDCASYAAQAQEVLAAQDGLLAAAAPPRMPTGYERRAVAAGRAVYELYYRKVPATRQEGAENSAAALAGKAQQLGADKAV